MKYVPFIFILFLFSCNDDDGIFLPWSGTPEGRATALKNGVSWNSLVDVYQTKPDTIDISLLNFNEQGYRRGTVGFCVIPLVESLIDLKCNPIDTINFSANTTVSTAVFYNLLDDGHVLGDSYKLLENDISNSFALTQIDNRNVSGEFNLTFIFDGRYSAKSDSSQPDTIHFTSGEFSFELN